jgi:hypothetical protein
VRNHHEAYEALRAALVAAIGATDAKAMDIAVCTLPPRELVGGHPDSLDSVYAGPTDAAPLTLQHKAERAGYKRWAHLQAVRAEAAQCLKWITNEAHSYAQKAIFCLDHASGARMLDTDLALKGALDALIYLCERLGCGVCQSKN